MTQETVTLEKEHIDLLHAIARRFENKWDDFDGRWLYDLIDIALDGDLEQVYNATKEMSKSYYDG